MAKRKKPNVKSLPEGYESCPVFEQVPLATVYELTPEAVEQVNRSMFSEAACERLLTLEWCALIDHPLALYSSRVLC